MARDITSAYTDVHTVCLQLCHITMICLRCCTIRVFSGNLLPDQRQPTTLTTTVISRKSFLCHFSEDGVCWCLKGFDPNTIKHSWLPYLQVDLLLCRCDWNLTVVVCFKEFKWLIWCLAHLFILKHGKRTCRTARMADVWGLESFVWLFLAAFESWVNAEAFSHLCTVLLMYCKESQAVKAIPKPITTQSFKDAVSPWCLQSRQSRSLLRQKP